MLEDLPKLQPLPKEPFKMQKYTEAKVQKNYRVFLGEDKHFYSIPYLRVGKNVQVSYTTETVEIYHEIARMVIHGRVALEFGYTTTPDYMPLKHQEYVRAKEWPCSGFSPLNCH